MYIGCLIPVACLTEVATQTDFTDLLLKTFILRCKVLIQQFGARQGPHSLWTV